MRTVIAPWIDPLSDIASELDVRIVSPDTMTIRDMGSAEFYVPEFSMRREPLELMAALPSLLVVQAVTAGVDHYFPWLPQGATLCAGVGIHDTSVAEHAITLALATLRELPAYLAPAARGRWDRRTVGSLADRHVTVVGVGSIGSALIERLRPFECTITPVVRTSREGHLGIEELDDVLSRTEVLFLCVPETPETTGLIDARRLAMLPDGAVVVNVGRGTTVVTDALVDELKRGRLRAALDVVDPEPLPSTDPLWQTSAIVTPHIAGNSTAFMPRAIRLVEAQLRRWARGEPMRHVIVEGEGS